MVNYNLNRFLVAQDPVYEQVLAELGAGKKRSHWMWFIFPQIIGLGKTHMAKLYSISDLDEARAYLEHPILGNRLIECTERVNKIENRSAHQIFGEPDFLKFRSSMTLFLKASEKEDCFSRALEYFYGGEEDELTGVRLALLH